MKFGGNVYFLYLCSEKWKKNDGVFAKRAGEYLKHSSTSEATISRLLINEKRHVFPYHLVSETFMAKPKSWVVVG